MARAFSLKLIVVVVASLSAAAALAPAYAAPPSSDRALAEAFRRPGAAFDPVLAALSAGRLVREVAAIAPGQVEPPAIALGFALRGTELTGLDVTGTPAGRQEIDAFRAQLRGRGFKPSEAGYTVYSRRP
jgi:hypothetical protein